MAGLQNLENPVQVKLFGFLLGLYQCSVINSVKSVAFLKQNIFLWCVKFGPHFSSQSLLLCTSIPNDIKLHYVKKLHKIHKNLIPMKLTTILYRVGVITF